jgi:nucleotide-binding universal stress UspA family protein
MELRTVELDDLASPRQAKVDSLRVRVFPGQHEQWVREARCYRLDEGHAEAGYGLFLESTGADPGLGKRLIEFDVSVPWRGRSAAYLAGMIEELDVGQIEVRTDDGTAFEPCLEFAATNGWKITLLASIYALETGMLRRAPQPEGAEVKRIAKEDLDAATALGAGPGGAPTDPVARALEEKRLWGLYHEGRLVGTAEVLPAAHHRYADLRPIIHPDSRRGGLATFLVGEVSHELLNQNHRLMTEASTSAWAWRRLAEKLGLTLAAHRLLLQKS